MTDKNFSLKMNQNGELMQSQSHLHKLTKAKYKPDTPFLWGPVSYLLMLICTTIDLSFFRSLFQRISYDEPAMILLEVSGMAFAADIVAAFAGILAKRIKQGLSKDKLNMVLLLSVPVFALIINGILRVATMSLSSADGTIDSATIALTIISIVIPICTSIGNFSIGCLTYDPLGQKMCREEMALDEIRDYIRRLEAIKKECDSFNPEQIIEMDRQHLVNAKKALINDALILSADAKIQLMEYLGNPTSTNILSNSHCNDIFNRLNRELQSLETACIGEAIPSSTIEETNTRKRVVNFSEAV